MGGPLIPTRAVGDTGLSLSRIGFGSAPTGDLRRAPTEDGARALLQAAWDAGIRYFEQEKNQGKGAALRRGIAAATGDVILFQDADLEYDPRDYARLVRPFVEDGADVVYGSRFLPRTGGASSTTATRSATGS